VAEVTGVGMEEEEVKRRKVCAEKGRGEGVGRQWLGNLGIIQRGAKKQLIRAFKPWKVRM